LQQEGEVVDINIAFAIITAVTIAKKNDKKKLPKLPSFRHIIVKNGHLDA
jgi:hypothetical protein